MQGGRVPKSLTWSNNLGYNIREADCTPHVETPVKVSVGGDTNIINSLNFCSQGSWLWEEGCAKTLGAEQPHREDGWDCPSSHCLGNISLRRQLG